MTSQKVRLGTIENRLGLGIKLTVQQRSGIALTSNNSAQETHLSPSVEATRPAGHLIQDERLWT